MSTVTGAPAETARALGFQDLMNGTAAAATPTAPTTAVVPVRNRRLPWLTVSSPVAGSITASLAIRHSANPVSCLVAEKTGCHDASGHPGGRQRHWSVTEA